MGALLKEQQALPPSFCHFHPTPLAGVSIRLPPVSRHFVSPLPLLSQAKISELAEAKRAAQVTSVDWPCHLPPS